MKIREYLYISVNVFLIGIIVYLTLSSNGEKSAFVNLSMVNEKFDMKKDLENKYNETANARSKILDSLKLELILMEKSIENTSNKSELYKYQTLKDNYFRKEREFSEENSNLTSNLSVEMWKQLNEYIEEYGQKYGYNFIFGAAGNGSLMYARQENDITDDVIRFINEKYHDKK